MYRHVYIHLYMHTDANTLIYSYIEEVFVTVVENVHGDPTVCISRKVLRLVILPPAMGK